MARMPNNICPKCGANLDKNGLCPYCGSSEDGNSYASELRATKLKRRVQELQKEIGDEQKEIDRLLKDNSPNGCLKVGLGLVIVAIAIIAASVTIFRKGDGIEIVVIGAIIAIPLVYAICKFCDNNGNEGVHKRLHNHRRAIKELTQEIEDIQNGID